MQPRSSLVLRTCPAFHHLRVGRAWERGRSCYNELVVHFTWGLDWGVLSTAEDHLNRGMEGSEGGELGILAWGRGAQGVLGGRHGAA